VSRRKGTDHAAALDARALILVLVAERHRRGWSQQDVATRIGTSQSAVSDLETGEAMPGLDLVCGYAAAIGRRLWVV